MRVFAAWGSWCRERGLRGVAALVVAVVGLVCVPVVARAASAVPGRPGVPTPPSAYRMGSIGAERVDLRTRRSRTYETSSGALFAQVFAGPVNFRDAAGRWRPIDSTLVDSPLAGYAARNRANDWTVDVPSDLGANPVRVRWGDNAVAFRLHGATGRPGVSGPRARYGDVMPGVSVSYEALAEAVKETLSLASAAAGSTFVFSVDTPAGVKPRLAEDGSVELVRGDAVVMVLAAPVVWDSAPNAAPSRHAHYDVQATSQGFTLTLNVDPAWLQDPARRFPVIVDPYVYPRALRDCTLDGGSPSTSFCDQQTLDVGYNGDHDHHALLDFDVNSVVPAGSQVLDSYLAAYLTAQSTTNTTQIGPHRVTHDWGAGATWDSFDGVQAWSTPGGDLDATAESESGFSAGDAPERRYWSVTSLMERWVDGDVADHGLALKADDATRVTNMVTFASSEDSDANLRPYLGIHYIPRLGLHRAFTYDRMDLSDRSRAAVNVANGNLVLSTTDLNVAGRGVGLSIGRTYNSLSQDLGTIGHGWRMSFEDKVEVGAHEASYQDPTGNGSVFLQQADGSYKSPPGVDATYASGSYGERLTFHRTDERRTFEQPEGYVIQDADAHGNHVDFTRDASHKVTSIQDTQGRTHTVSYDPTTGMLQRIEDSTGRHVDYAMGGNWLSEFTDADGHSTSYHYNAEGQLDQITDARGNQILIGYDSEARVSAISRRVDGTTANDVTTSYSYAAPGSACQAADQAVGQTVKTDPRGEQTTYCWNRLGRVVRTRNALAQETTKSYTANADPSQVEDFAGTAAAGTTAFTYDLSGSNPTYNLTQIDQPAGERESGTYWSAASNPNDPQRRYRLRQDISPQGSSTFYGYDDAGDLTSVKDSDTSPANQATLAYNGDGTLATATDGNGHQTTYSYDTDGNVTRVSPPVASNPSGIAQLGDTTYTYDALSRVKTVTDGRGTTQTLSYDGEDRVVRVDVSDGSWWTFCYDPNGNLTERTNSAGQTTTYTYDKLNRRTSETFPGGVSNTYTYDKDGNIASVIDANGTVSYGYDAINRLASITSPTAPGTSTDAVSYAYDDSSPTHKQTLSFPGGASDEVSRDGSGKIIKVLVKDSAGNTLARREYSYSYSPAGGGSAQSELVQTLTRLNGDVTSYGYGPVEQLRSAETTNAGSSVGSYRYVFDDALNRTSKIHTDASGTTTTTSAYNADNELCWSTTAATSHTACDDPPSGATLYGYDANGNQSSGGSGSAKTYDPLDRLTSLGGETMSYLSPDNTELVADGSRTLANDLLGLSAETVGSTTTAIARDPISGAPSSLRDGTNKRYFIADNIGSTTGLLDASSGGSIARSYSYDPDGNATTTGSGPSTDLQFAGGYGTHGLLHFGARYYDSATARWTQRDPVNHAKDPREANAYLYVGANPIAYVDPTGQSLLKKIAGGAAVVVGNVAGVALAGACIVATEAIDTPHCLLAGAGVALEGDLLGTALITSKD